MDRAKRINSIIVFVNCTGLKYNINELRSEEDLEGRRGEKLLHQ